MAKKAVLWTFLVILIAGLSVSMYYLITKIKVSNVECDINRVCYVLDSNGEQVESETITEEKFGKLVYSKNFTNELLAGLEKEGYGFVGWFSDSEFKNTVTTETKLNEKNIAVNKKEKSATIYAYLMPNTYSNMMYLGVGDGRVRSSKNEVVYGQTIGELVESGNLTAKNDVENKVFYAWYADSRFTQKLDNETKLTFENVRFDPIMNTFMVYAKYISTENCTLVYDNTDLPNGNINYGAVLDLTTTPIKDGYDFDGWYFDKELENKIDTENEVLLNFETVDFDGTNFHIYAKWAPKTITLTFNASDGVCNETSKEVVVGEAYGTLPTATKESCKFAGWYTASDCDVTTKISSEDLVKFTVDSTIYANFVAENMQAFTVKKSDNVNYNIFYSTDEGLNWSNLHNDTTNTANELTYYIQNGYMWKIETVTNATYFNLNCEATQTGTAEEDKVIELKAIGKQFTLILNTDNDATGNSEMQKVYGSSFEGSLPNIKKSGYVLDGWYKEEACTTKLSVQDVFTTDTVTFDGDTANIYAKWIAKQVKVNTIAIAANTRTTGISVKYKLINDNQEYLLTNSSTSKIISGVATGTYDLLACANLQDGSNTFINTNLKITVTDETDFTEVYVYYCPLYVSIHEDEANKGINGSNTIEETDDGESFKYYKTGWFLKGQQFEIEVEVNTGYHFVNWTWKDGGRTINDNLSTTNPITYEINRRMKIWPHTAKNVYNIEFNTNGGDEIALATREYLSTLSDEALPVPTRRGCVFMGWFADSEFTKPVTNATTIDNTTFAEQQLINNNSTLTLYAKWLENEVVINPKRVASSTVGVPKDYIEVKLYDEINDRFISHSSKDTGTWTFNAVPAGTYKIYASSKYNNENISSIKDDTGVEVELVQAKDDNGVITLTVEEPTVSGEAINNNPSPVQIDYYPLYLRGNDSDDESDAESTGITSVNQNKVRYLKGQTTTISAEVAFGYNFKGWYNKSGDILKYSEIERSITINAKTTLIAKAEAIDYKIVYHNGATENEKTKTYGTSFVSEDLNTAEGNGVFKGWSTKSDSIADENIITTETVFNISNLSDFDGEKFHIYAAFVTQCEIKNAETGETLTTIGYGSTPTTLLVPQKKVNKPGYNFLGFKLVDEEADLLAINSVPAPDNENYSCNLAANFAGITNTNKEWIYFAKEYITLYPAYEPKTTTITVYDNIDGEYTLTITYGESTVKKDNVDFHGISGFNLVYQYNGTTTTSIIIGTDGKLQDVAGFTTSVDGVVVWAYDGEVLELRTKIAQQE